jgi:septal ring factor EnvC (AmiA/AmiB activator)
MTKDELIIEHLGRCTENNLFKASVEHWLATGKASGSFRAFLHSMMEDHTKQQITSLESQLKERDERIKQYNKMLDPILDWGQSPESGLKLGQSITKEVLRMAKESKEKDQEIQALKEALKDAIKGFESAIMLAQTDFYSNYFKEVQDRCRKLIGD